MRIVARNVTTFYQPQYEVLRQRLGARRVGQVTLSAPSELEELRGENARLREENTRLRRELETLRPAPAPASDLDDASIRFSLLELDDE